ncbi:hypothetical protein [Paenibacillus silvae]|uniref:hypothetical protein n=1 Tax=Paenibacillus silvae TaxID=1325358 RepID=UPI00142DF64E|nr:hypothetical protein [Paenibacillus silvae]
MRNVYVVDPPGGTGQYCECGQEAMFLLGLSDKEKPHHICPDCISEIAKRIIDALV